MKNKKWIKISSLVLAIMLTACANHAKDTDTKEEKNIKASAPKNEQKEDKQTTELVIEEGKYVGQIDESSIEVEKTNGDIIVLRLTDEVRETITALHDGSAVSITYRKDDNDQNMLEKIQTIDSAKEMPPAAKTLEYTVNGTKVQKEAELTNSEQNYSFYRIGEFEFTAEEPGKDLLFSSQNAETYARIEPLSEDTSLDDLKKWAHDELAAIGEVKEVKGVEAAGPSFETTELFLEAEKDSFKKCIVIQKLEDGKMMKYTVSLPNADHSDDKEQAIWAMLATVQSNDE
jgi:hypothetical protein